MRGARWLGLLAGASLLAGSTAWAADPLTITLTTNEVDFVPGRQIQVSVGVETSGIAGTSADLYLGVVLPDGSTVVAFGPGGTPGVATLANLSTLPALAQGLSLAAPLTVPPQVLLDYTWTGSEPTGEYLLFAAAVRAGGLADGALGPADLLALVTRALRLEPGGGGDWHAFADSRLVDSATSALTFLQARAPSLCAGAQPGASLTLPEAVSRLVAGLQELAGGTAPLDSFVAGLGDLSRIPVVAAAALADRKPHAALAALLLAVVTGPPSPTHLVNAAGLASLLGFPSEALSLLAAADQLGVEPDSPLGLPGRALARNNRGHALLQLGRWPEAVAALEEAVALAPQLSEARTNLSLAEMCQGNEERALRLFRAGRWRTLAGPIPTIPEPALPTSSPGPDTVVTIHATQPTALERPPSPGLLTVRRSGDPGVELTVAYEVTGTANPGTDYVPLPGSVTLPAGVLSADIAVLPRGDDIAEADETVVVTLAPGSGYEVGAANTATVTMGDLLLPAVQVRRAALPGSPTGAIEVPQVFDLSLGQEGQLPTIPYPDTLEQVVELVPLYAALDAQFTTRQGSRNARLLQIHDLLSGRPPLPLLVLRRISDTFIAMSSYRAEPALHGLVAEFDAAEAAVHRIFADLAGALVNNHVLHAQAVTACPFDSSHNACVQAATNQYFCNPISATHPRWRSAMGRLDTAARGLFGPASKFMSAVASNLADPLYHDQAMIQGLETAADTIFYVQLAQNAFFYTDIIETILKTPGPFGCAVTPPPLPGPEVGPPQVFDAGACPPALTAAKVQLKFLDVLSLSFNCESVELEVAQPGLGLFGQIGFALRPGQNLEATIFVGAKASVPGLPLSAKEGFFLRVDSQQFRDAGFKVSASTLAGTPAGGLKIDSPFNMEFGVAAASQYLGGD